MTRLLSPAKVNLFLHVIGKRADGYHDLISLMCCISLYDVITLTVGQKGIRVQCDHAEVPDDESNLAHRAATHFYRTLHERGIEKKRRVEADGVTILIEKQIPVAAGLGGGSSNAATVLTGLNRHYGEPFSRSALSDMGRAIGADVPFFIHQKPAVATGIGDELKPYRGIRARSMLVVCPQISVSTRTVYKNLNLGLTKCEKKIKNFPFEMPIFDEKRHLCNDLETVTIPAHPEVQAIKDQLLELGAAGALMSGSGPAVFGLFADRKDARQAFDALEKHGVGRLYAAEILT